MSLITVSQQSLLILLYTASCLLLLPKISTEFGLIICSDITLDCLLQDIQRLILIPEAEISEQIVWSNIIKQLTDKIWEIYEDNINCNIHCTAK